MRASCRLADHSRWARRTLTLLDAIANLSTPAGVSVARHTAYNLAGSAVSIGVTLITVPLYLKLIGLERFGVLSLCWVFVGYFAFFDFGIGRATAQKMATLAGKHAEERSRLFWTSAALSAALALIGVLLFWPIATFALTWMEASPALLAEARAALWLIMLIVPLAIFQSFLSGATEGRRAFGPINIIGVIGSVLTAVLPLLTAIVIEPRIDLLVAATIVARLLVLGALALLCVGLVPLTRPALARKSDIASLLKFGGWVSATGIAAAVLLHFEKLLIGWRLGAASVSIYVIPFNLLQRFLSIPHSLSSALFPAVASTSTEEGRSVARQSTLALNDVFTVITTTGMAIVFTFLSVWIGPDLAARATPIAIILLGGIWFNVLAFPPYSFLQATGRPEIVTYVTWVQLPLYLPLLFLMVAWFGLIGAAIAWSLRVAAEAIAYLVISRLFRDLAPKLLMGFALVIAAATISLLSGLSELGRWLLLTAIVALSCWTARHSLALLIEKIRARAGSPQPVVQQANNKV